MKKNTRFRSCLFSSQLLSFILLIINLTVPNNSYAFNITFDFFREASAETIVFDTITVTPGPDVETGDPNGNCFGGGCRNDDQGGAGGEGGASPDGSPKFLPPSDRAGDGKNGSQKSRSQRIHEYQLNLKKMIDNANDEIDKIEKETQDENEKAQSEQYKQHEQNSSPRPHFCSLSSCDPSTAPIEPIFDFKNFYENKNPGDFFKEVLKGIPDPSGNGFLTDLASGIGGSYIDYKPYKSSHSDEFEKLRERLTNFSSEGPQQWDAKVAAFDTIRRADNAYLENQNDVGEILTNAAIILVDIATDIIPLTSVPKDAYRFFVGKDPMSGAELSSLDRAMAGCFVILLGGGRIFGTAFKGLKEVGIISKASTSEMALVKKMMDSLTALRAKIKNGIEKAFDYVKNSRLGTRVGDLRDLNKRIIKSARKLGIKTEVGTKVYTKLYSALETLPNGLKVQRISEGTDSAKIAVIGRKMDGVVNNTIEHLEKNGIKIEKFSPSAEAVKDFENFVNKNGRVPDFNEQLSTLTFKENKSWINKLKKEGYTVLDMGNPGNVSQLSPFYEMEKELLFK